MFTTEELAQLGSFVETKVKDAVDAIKGDVQAVEQTPAVEDAVKAVEYYVHLADGSVQTMTASDLDAAGTHVNGVAVIGKYEVGG